MMKSFYLLCFVMLTLLASCVPASSQQDLFSNAVSSRLTAEAANDMAEFMEQSLSKTAEAPIIDITSTAAGLIAVQTQISIDRTSTAVVWTPTITPSPTADATQTKAFIVLKAEESAYQNSAARDALQLQREESNNAFWAAMGQMAPFLAIVLLAGGILLFYTIITRKQRFQPIQVDPRGNPIPVMDTVNGTITDPDSNPNYRSYTADDILKRLLELYLMKKFGLQSGLPQITEKRQDATKERDQMIDLATRGLLPETPAQARERKQDAGQQAMKLLTGPTLDSRFKIVDDPNHLQVLDGEIIETLDHDWKEAKK